MADVAVTGQNLFRSYELRSGGLQPQRQEITAKESQGSTHYTCHAWVANKLYVCTNQGEIILLDGKTCKGVQEYGPSDGLGIEHIVACNKGFVTGGEANSLYFYTLDSEDSKGVFSRRNTNAVTLSSQLPELGKARIRSLAKSPNDKWLLISLDNNQIVKAELNLQNYEHMKYEYLHYYAHSAPVHCAVHDVD